MKTTTPNVLGSLAILVSAAHAEPPRIRCEGVLGNSGEQGVTLARFATKRPQDQRDGLGVVCDRFGTLWDRAGPGQMNRYALDGRLLASVALPPTPPSNRDAVALVGDRLLILLKEDLWSLDVAAPSPTPGRTGLGIRAMARTASGGSVLVVLRDDPPRLALYDPVANATEPLPWPPVGDATPGLGVTPKGAPLAFDPSSKAVYELSEQTWRKVGSFREGTPQTVDGFYWVGQWHGTVKRFDAQFAPAPGVVLGGASGSFIGHLEGNYEVNSPTAIAAVGPSTYAIGGLGCVAHLAAWDGGARRLVLLRRIGALQGIRGHLALDKRGRVRVPAGIWEWDDAPDAPVRASRGISGNGQVAVFGNGAFFSAAFVYGSSPAVTWGDFGAEANSASDRGGPKTEFHDQVRGCVALRDDKQWRTLRVTAKGRMVETRHDMTGRPLADVATGELDMLASAGVPAALACLADGRILAATDGAIVEIARAEAFGDWQEVHSWTGIGDFRFGAGLAVSADGGTVWISDAANHRVLCADEALATVLGVFGGARGDNLASCDGPTAIAAAGRRAVVYDEGNQRILKLSLP